MSVFHSIVFKRGYKYLSRSQAEILANLGFSGMLEDKCQQNVYCFPNENSVIVELSLPDVMELSKMFKVEILKPYIIISTY